MPVSLFTQKDRRQFLKGLAGVGCYLGSDSATAATGGEEFWALFSDPHVAADAALEARGVNMVANLERCVKQVLDVGIKPHGVMINGDCAYLDGQLEDYSQLLRSLGPLAAERVQVHCTLGNHDDRKAFRAAMSQPGVEPLMEEKHVTVLSSARVHWVLLDSLHEVNVTPGRLGDEQLGWLRRTLAKLDERPVLVMVHHTPVFLEIPEESNKGLLDSLALAEVLKAFPKVRGLIFGHSHHWLVQERQAGLPWLIDLPPVAYVFAQNQPSGWVKAMVSDQGVKLELRCLNPDHAEHKRQVEIAF